MLKFLDQAIEKFRVVPAQTLNQNFSVISHQWREKKRGPCGGRQRAER
jgi:hypothetical protein